MNYPGISAAHPHLGKHQNSHWEPNKIVRQKNYDAVDICFDTSHVLTTLIDLCRDVEKDSSQTTLANKAHPLPCPRLRIPKLFENLFLACREVAKRN